MEGVVLNYKLAWVDEKDNSILHSKMFETLEESILESKGKKEFMLFSLKKMEDGSYTWDLLPYGNYNSFVAGMSIKKFFNENKAIILSALGIVILIKLIKG